jgi:hypothetical protein
MSYALARQLINAALTEARNAASDAMSLGNDPSSANATHDALLSLLDEFTLSNTGDPVSEDYASQVQSLGLQAYGIANDTSTDAFQNVADTVVGGAKDWFATVSFWPNLDPANFSLGIVGWGALVIGGYWYLFKRKAS